MSEKILQDTESREDGPKYSIKLDLERDAANWYGAISKKVSHGVDWTAKMDPEIVKRASGLEKEAAMQIIIPHLTELYHRDEVKLTASLEFFEREFQEKFAKGCDLLVEAMDGRELYRDEFSIYLTTISRCPYNFNEGSLLCSAASKAPVDIFLHELCHFQFIQHWRNNSESPVSKLSYEAFDYLKESLTIILDEKFVPIMSKPDKGYTVHAALRARLKEQWTRERDFQKLIDYGLEILPEFVK